MPRAKRCFSISASGGLTLFFPYIRLYLTELHGECAWNHFGMFYYFSGFIGYLLLGHLLVRYDTLNWRKTLLIAVPLVGIGFAFTYGMFLYSDAHVGELFKAMTYSLNGAVTYPEANDPQRWQVIEIFYGYLTPNVAMMTAGLFMILQKIKPSAAARRIWTELSTYSYGIFLVHYIVILWLGSTLIPVMTACFAHLPAPLQLSAFQMPILAVLTLLISYALTKLLAYVPGAKYITG